MKLPKFRLFIPLVFIFILYFAIRFQHLLAIPVFGDEAIYLRWSQLIKNVDTLRFVPLSDGKQPLFMWITAICLKFISDPLLAGRLISIMAGAGTIACLYFFSLLFFNPAVALISSFCYVFLPFAFFFDRLALPDNLLSFFGTLSMLLSFVLAKTPRFDLSLLLGFSLGLAWLTKSPAIYFVVLSFATFLFYRPNNYKKTYLPLISTFVSFIIYNILRLGPQFNQIALRNRDYVWPLAEVIKHPLDPFIPHLRDIFTIYSQYISIPVFLVSLLGFFLSRRYFQRHHHPNLLLLWLLPLLSNAIVAKVFTARYVLFTLPPLILLLSLGIYYAIKFCQQYFHHLIFEIFVLILVFSFNCFWIYHLSFDPFAANLPSTETGYLTGWTSGWGIKDASEFLKQRSKTANVIVGTEGYFGTLPDGLQIYTDGIKNLTVFGVGIDLVKVPEKLIDARNHGDEVYLLINQNRLKLTLDEQNKVTLVNRYPKPGNDYLLLYRLN